MHEPKIVPARSPLGDPSFSAALEHGRRVCAQPPDRRAPGHIERPARRRQRRRREASPSFTRTPQGIVPHPAEIVGALVRDGADIDAPVVGAGHQETALHWAASNDDVELIDALLDAGADIERPGSSIRRRPSRCSPPPGYGQMQAVRRLVERGAVYFVWHAAALGMMPELARVAGGRAFPG